MCNKSMTEYMYLCTYEVYFLEVFKHETVSTSRDLGIEYSSNKIL